MPRVVAVSAVVVVVLLGAAQLALPAIAERRIEDRLERDGGSAKADVSAFPALRLLFGDGDSLEVTGSGLRVDPTAQQDVLARIDGFDEVDVALAQVDAGPFQVEAFELARGEGERDYSVEVAGTTSGREFARYVGSRAGGPLGGLLGDLATGGLPAAGSEIPVDVSAAIRSREGEIETRDARGTVAGIPAGPLVDLVVEAVVRRL